MSFKIKTIILLAFLISSCDHEHTKEYYLQNNLTSEIVVNYDVDGEVDTTSIGVNQEELIYIHHYVRGSVGVKDERYDDLISNIVIRMDTVSREMDESLWEYEQLDKYNAKYMMLIDSI